MNRALLTENNDTVKGIRLAAAVVLLALSLIIKFPIDAVKYVVLLLTAAVSICDVALNVIECVNHKDYFATPVILSVSVLLAFLLGIVKIEIAVDAAAMCVIYLLGTFVLDYAIGGTKNTARAMYQHQSDEIVSRLKDVQGKDGVLRTLLEEDISSALERILVFAGAFAAVFALIVPIVTNFISFADSLHRALMIFVICTPTSVLISLKFVALMAMAASAGKGTVFGSASQMEKVAQADTAIIDKAGIYSGSMPKVLSFDSSVTDQTTFMRFATHAAYYSEQPFAKVLDTFNTEDYIPELISEFKEIPGCGVELKIGPNPVVLATRAYFTANGTELPESHERPGVVEYCLFIKGMYVGYICFSLDFNEKAQPLCDELKENGIKECILLTEDEEAETAEFAEICGFDRFYAECTEESKKKLVEENHPERTVYIYADSFGEHSAASAELRVGKKSRYADGLVFPEALSAMPEAIRYCRRMRELMSFNAIFAFVVKALLIFLSVNGKCTMWFAFLLDTAATIGTILLSVRVVGVSPLQMLRDRSFAPSDEAAEENNV